MESSSASKVAQPHSTACEAGEQGETAGTAPTTPDEVIDAADEEGVETNDEEEIDEEEEEDDDDEITNFTQSDIVSVFVGPKRKRFYLHRDLICERSPFMEKCLKNDHFEEGHKNEVYLPEDDPKAFSIVVDWIYRSTLPSRTDPLFDIQDMSAAYCLADKFSMEELQNSIMDTIRASFLRKENESCKIPSFAALTLAHLNGPNKSPLKRFLVEHLVFHMMKHSHWYHQLKRDSPSRIELEEIYKIPELVAYLMKKIQQWQIEQWKDPSMWEKCCYHVHGTTTCAARQAAQTAKAKQVRLDIPPGFSSSSLSRSVWGHGGPGNWPSSGSAWA